MLDDTPNTPAQNIAGKMQILGPPKRVISLHNRRTLCGMIFFNTSLIYDKIYHQKDIVFAISDALKIVLPAHKSSRLGV